MKSFVFSLMLLIVAFAMVDTAHAAGGQQLQLPICRVPGGQFQGTISDGHFTDPATYYDTDEDGDVDRIYTRDRYGFDWSYTWCEECGEYHLDGDETSQGSFTVTSQTDEGTEVVWESSGPIVSGTISGF